jgi:hypothetical protein
MLIAATLCPAPPLLARELTGARPVLPELRQACREAVDALAATRPDLVVVVGVAGESRTFDPADRLDLSAYAPALRAATRDAGEAAPDAGPGLPLTIGLGSRLLDDAGYRGRREMQSVGEGTPPDACAALGSRLAVAARRVALLVMADGSARRSRRAPGYLDPRAAPFDAEVGRAIRAGDMAALLALDGRLAAELLATGRPAWQVLAGAMDGRRPSCVLRYDDDPFGVAYLVASLSVG